MGKKASNVDGSASKSTGESLKAEKKGGSTLAIAAAVVVVLLAVAFALRPGEPAGLPAPPAVKEAAIADSTPLSTASAVPVATGSGSSDVRWKPKTLSVVLPCAGEGLFAKKTVQSVADSVPGGIGGAILADIVVVDDGSSPPLGEEFLTKDFQKKYPVTIVRHEKAIGLMGAKSAGAAVATGDVIVFFDCHVAPQGDWYQEFLGSIAENYRRIVVPVITDLDIDTWKERSRAMSFAKCYLTWDADFKWVEIESPHMPALSGGLLGISRRWWNETGGYDPGMKGWGGENIDQSLRTWLCGGEIVSLSKAFVAHMWRKPEDKRTDKNYEVSVIDALKNKARAVLGWYGDYIEKASEFQTLNWVGVGKKRKGVDAMMGGMEKPNLNTDVSNFREVHDRLQCKPFAWFLWRFRHIYVDGGMLPPETFQLQEVATGMCLTLLGPMGVHPEGRAHAALLPCNNTGLPAHLHPDAQRWHLRNKRPSTGKCCSAIGSWNTDQCIVQLIPDGVLQTVVCDVSGQQVSAWDVTDENHPKAAPGQLLFNGKCLVADLKAQGLQIAKGVMSPKMKFGKCKSKKSGAEPKWRRVAPQVPLETALYDKALLEKPELFQGE